MQYSFSTIGYIDMSWKSPRDFPIKAVVEAAKLVMWNNFFQFGDKYYKQLCGTAMGTNAAAPWAIIYYASYEEALLIPP